MSGLNITTKTAQNVATSVKRQFGDESGVQLKDDDILRWVNDGQREIVHKNRVLKGKAVIPAVAGQADYLLPEASIAAIESIHFNNIPVPGIPYPQVEDFIARYPHTSNGGGPGTPQMWYEWGGTITFFPAPDTTENISLLYTRNPDELVTLGDTLSLPDKYFNTLVDYVLSQAYAMDEDWEASNYKNQQFAANLDTSADDERTTSNMVYPSVIVVEDY